jgi:hypothetical protein
MFLPVNNEPGDNDNGNGMAGETLVDPRRCFLAFDTARRERVVPDDVAASMNDIAPDRTCRLVLPSKTLEPVV